MDVSHDDYNQLDVAMQQFIKTLRRPQYWAHISAIAGVELDRTGASLLHLLNRRGNCRVQDAADVIGVEPPSITRKTQELERLGYISRVQSDTDKRAVALQITDAGRELSDKLWAAKQAFIAQAIADWPANERHQFVQLFTKFSDSIAASSNKHE